jgi:ATP-binding cassette subfamily B protein
MSLTRLYIRVLGLLGKEARLGWILAGANLLLAGASSSEPVLFRRIVDVLSGKASASPLEVSPASRCCGWAAFGPARHLMQCRGRPHADRLAHRQRQVVLTVLQARMQLP